MAKKTIFLTPEDDLGAIINASEPGDLIQLSEGTYRTKFTIFVNSLTIRGAGAVAAVAAWRRLWQRGGGCGGAAMAVAARRLFWQRGGISTAL